MIRVRLLGGFEVWHGDRQLRGFESQKVRALLIYLACYRGRTFSRDRLAALLWPEQSAEAGRHALRQALYNLRSALPGRDSPKPPILATHLDVRLNPEAYLWLDVAAFEEEVRRGSTGEGPDIHALASAAQIYRGDFLSGFHVRDSDEFEEWLISEQERLRESAVEVLRTLVDSYRQRGEYRFGIHYSRRLVALEPLAEESRRDLMNLLALAGRRTQALAEFEALEKQLVDELDVEPTAETRKLYEEIRDEAPAERSAIDAEPIGPIVPLVGRQAAWERLREEWSLAHHQGPRLTVVEGELGIGKTRLLRTFLDATATPRRSTVLRATGRRLAVPTTLSLFVDLLRCAELESAADMRGPQRDDLPREVVRDLARLLPEVDGGAETAAPLSPEEIPRLHGSIAAYLRGFCRGLSRSPLVIFLDSVQDADPASLDAIAALPREFAHQSVWIVVAIRADFAGIADRLNSSGLPFGHIVLPRLDRAAIDEVAFNLVGEDSAGDLGRWLADRSEGLPLAVAEFVNFLWDEASLAPREGGGWDLQRPLEDLDVAGISNLESLLAARVRRLPASARRLATLAAVFGPTFETSLLERAANEHPAVVELSLELLVRRWLIRQSFRYWTTRGRESEMALWDRRARRGSFEFLHSATRGALGETVASQRRRALHFQVGEVFEREQDPTRLPEEIAHHFFCAEQWERARPHLERAAERAHALAALETSEEIRALIRQSER